MQFLLLFLFNGKMDTMKNISHITRNYMYTILERRFSEFLHGYLVCWIAPRFCRHLAYDSCHESVLLIKYPVFTLIFRTRFGKNKPKTKEESIKVEYRATVCLVSSKIFTPPPPSPPGECVLPPQQRIHNS
jgi:hypothetical protein